MHILTVIGARPQFVKASPVSRALCDHGLDEVLVHTGQHYDYEMSQIFFDELCIPKPGINLGIRAGSHAEQTASMLCGLERAIQKHEPDWVLLYGDTNSTLAGALAASKLQVPIAHIEAGIRVPESRTPEEINRRIVDTVSDILFAPAWTAVKNLKNENIPRERIYFVGDVMYDAVLAYGDKADQHSKILDMLTLRSGEYVLATCHRPENTDDPIRLRTIVEALCRIAQVMAVVLPLHPRTRRCLEYNGLLNAFESCILVVEPIGYLDMLKLERNAAVIATDSGGVQREALYCRVPCVTFRDRTEWVELVEARWNRLCPPQSVECIVNAVISMIGVRGREAEPYGQGNAAEKIALALSSI